MISTEEGSPGVRLAHDWYPRKLPANVVIGERSWCYSAFGFLHYQSAHGVGVQIGHDTGVYNGTFFDLGSNGRIEIGNYVTLVGAIISTSSRVVIGDYAFLAHEVVLADSFAAVPGDQRGTASTRARDIAIGRNSWIGARAVLLGGASIGEGAIVGAAAVVDSEVPPFSVVAGNPARIVGEARSASAPTNGLRPK